MFLRMINALTAFYLIGSLFEPAVVIRAHDLTGVKPWHRGCYKLRSNISFSLFDWLENPTDGSHTSGYYSTYEGLKSPPVQGTAHCPQISLPYVAVLDPNHFYCIDSIEHLLPVEQLDGVACTERCSDVLPCGSSSQQYVSIYNTSYIPYIYNSTFSEPISKRFTHRTLEYAVTIALDHPYGFGLIGESMVEAQVPVQCHFSIDGQLVSTSDAVEEAISADNSMVVCTLGYKFFEQGSFILEVDIVTDWQTLKLSHRINVSHEVPHSPDIVVYLSDFELPTCISNQQELIATQHQQTVKVYVDTATPFEASIGQGFNVTFDWTFDNDTTHSYTSDSRVCSSTCYRSIVTHTFTTLGIHEIAVNFSNTYGSVQSSLSVIVVSKDIHNVTVTPDKTVLRFWEPTTIHFSILTSMRYFTYVRVDQGDGDIKRFSAADPAISNVDHLFRPQANSKYPQVTSDYGVGCLLSFDVATIYATGEGHFNLTWSVFNNGTTVNSTQPILYSVYKKIRGLTFQGHTSYQIGMTANISANCSEVSDEHTTRWTLVDDATGNVTFTVTEEKGDVFTYPMNETGTFILRCEIWNPINEKAVNEIAVTVLDRLGNLTAEASIGTSLISTHRTLTFRVHLDSGLGAEYMWNVTSVGGSVAHVAPTNLGLTGESQVTFVRPDVYHIAVYARIGPSRTALLRVQTVQVYERITYFTCLAEPRSSSNCSISASVRTGSSINMTFYYPNETFTRDLSALNRTTVNPTSCPGIGIHEISVVATNPISTLQLMCPVVVKPEATSVTVAVTAAYHVQLQATVLPEEVGSNVIYMWRYNQGGREREHISALPFIALPELFAHQDISGNLVIYGLKGGARQQSFDGYEHKLPLLHYQCVVKPGDLVTITLKNTDSYSNATLSAFSHRCTFTLSNSSQAMCNVTSDIAQVSNISLTLRSVSGEEVRVHSAIAVVPELPTSVDISCPSNVIASSHSQSLIRAELGELGNYYAYYTWYRDDVKLAYTSESAKLYGFHYEGQYNVTVVATNEWGSVSKSCIVTATNALIELEIKPAIVHKVDEWFRLQQQDPTEITLKVYGPRTLANITVDYGDGEKETYRSHQISGFIWTVEGFSWNTTKLYHHYAQDKQYRVHITVSTSHTTLNATGIVYKSIAKIKGEVEGPDRRSNYERGDTAVLNITVGEGDYLTFDWVYDGPVEVIETSKNHSKARVTFRQLGRPSISCKIYNPAYPEGIVVDFSNRLLVVVKPNQKVVGTVGDIASAELSGSSLNVTFRLRYSPGPDNATVRLFGDYSNQPSHEVLTTGNCRDQDLGISIITVCTAYASYVYYKTGRYNVTMQLTVGNFFEFASMMFEVLPPKTSLVFTDAHEIKQDVPTYYFPFGDTSTFSVEFQTSDPLDTEVEYHWSFGDQSEVVVTAGLKSNITYKYMSMKEAGFNVNVRAETNRENISVGAIARVFIYKSIQRVELTVQGRSWSDDNQGQLYFLPSELEDDLLLVVKVYPDHVPFTSCHIVKVYPSKSPSITNSFFPENTQVEMHAYDRSFVINSFRSISKLVLSALCVEVRPPNAPIEQKYADVLTVHRRSPLASITYRQPWAEEDQVDVQVGNNLTYNCFVVNNYMENYYKHYVNDQVLREGMGKSKVSFVPDSEGIYNLTCEVDNGISRGKVTLLLPVLNFSCDVTLKITPKSFSNEQAQRQVGEWYSSEVVTLQGIANHRNCELVNELAMRWEVTTAAGETVKIEPSYFSDLYLTPRTLSPGNYLAKFIVSIPGTQFVKYISEPIVIKETPFRAIISGGIARQIDLSIPQLVELDATSSFDPDCPECNDLTFIWACNILHQDNTSCFINNKSLEFASGNKTLVNTTHLVNREVGTAYKISLVASKGSRNVVSKQTWESRPFGAATSSNVEARCETCTDGPDLESSVVRPVVFKVRCNSANPSTCQNVKYSWVMKIVPYFSKSKPVLERVCSLRPTMFITTPSPASTVSTTTASSTTPVYISTTTPAIGSGALGPMSPTEEETDDDVRAFPFENLMEDDGSGNYDPPAPEMPFTATQASIFDNLDYSHAYGSGGNTRRRPYTTTTPSYSTAAPTHVILQGCQCAIDGDLVVTNFNTTLYEKSRERVPKLAEGTLTGFSSKEFIIKPDTLNPESTYLLELSAQVGPQVAHHVYRLNTGTVPVDVECFPSFSNRDASGRVLAWYAFDEYAGEELSRAYEVQCNLGRYPKYEYVQEVYIERIPGELEIVSRAYSEDLLGLQILPAGFPEYNYSVNIEVHVVDLNGNRVISCPGENAGRRVEHRILPKNFTNTSATDVVYDLVHAGEEFDWYDDCRVQGHVFTIRNNMLGVCEILNRVSSIEVSAEERRKRTATRSLLLRQLMQTPHRYTAEVEQTLVVLRSIVKVKPELDSNSTALAANLLVQLVDKFIAYEPRDRARDVNFTTHMVIDISSKLVRCLSANEGNLYGHTAKLERIINTIIMASFKDRLLPTATGETTRTVHGMTIVTSQYTEIRDETIGYGDVSFTVPAAMLYQLKADFNVEDCHTASMIEYGSNPFKQGIDSVVTALTLYDCDGREMKVNEKRNAEARISFTLPSISNNTEETEANYTIHKELMNFHVIEIPKGDLAGKSLNVLFKFTMYEGHTFPIRILVRRDEPPTPHEGDSDMTKDVATADSELQLFLDNADFGSASRLYLAVADANFNEGKPRGAEIKERSYNVTSWWSECVYWDTKQQDWSGRGCAVTRETTLNVSHCSCNHFTAFASKREVVRIKLYKHSVDKYFSLKHYPTTKVMVSLVLIFYVVLAIVCYVADRKSPVQEKVIAIQDNSPADRQRYIITIETGSEPGSGTTAKVSLVLHGEEGMSGMRELIGPPDSNVFLANSRDTFLLTLPANLGPIWKVQLWHNNKGSSPGWYVKRVTVRDVETGQSYYFLCEQWLAVEESDGKVEREFMALDSHIGFKVVFKVKAPQYFNDYHLIRSLIYKPTFSHFSRVERLTCVFVGLLAHMVLCTTYFYLQVEEYRGQYNLFDLSSKTVLLSLAVNVIACPIMLILSMIFRRSSVGGRPIFPSKDKKYKMAAKCGENIAVDGQSVQPPAGSHTFLEQSVQHWQSLQEWAQKQWEKRYQKAQLAGEELSAVEMQMQEQVLTLAGTQSNGGIFSSRVDQSKIGSQSDVKCLIANSDSDTNSNATSTHGSSVRSFMKSRRWFLPPWCRLLAWALCIGCATSSAYATIYYSKEFQEGRFVLWLQSIFVTFLFCNFIIQPLGILSKAVATAVWYRRDPTVLQHFPDRYEDDIEEIRLRFSNMSDEDEITRGTRARQRSRYLRFARPPQEKQLIAARKRTMKEKKFMKLGAECFVLALTLALLIIMVFCCERSKTFDLNRNIKTIIATNDITARQQGFLNISRPVHMWDWLQNDFKDLLFTEHAQNLGSSIIIGNATRIKQVRVQEEVCAAKDLMPSWTMRDMCYPPYSRYTVNKETYSYGNDSVSYSKVTRTEDALLYGHLTSYTESGYELLLPVTESAYLEVLEELRTSGWVDQKTRAVFVELTIYNLPANLYCSVTALLEFSATGQIIPSIDVDSAKLYKYTSTIGYVVLTAELVFIFVYLCQLHFNIMSVVRLKKKYFTQIWNVLDCMYMMLSLAYIVIYLYRFEVVEMLHNELRHSFHSAFVSVAPLVFWDRVLCLLLGLLLFITVVKTLKLFRYIKTFARLGNVYRRAARDIRAFAVFFLLLIITYTNLGVLLFQPVSYSFSDYWHGVMSVTAYLSGSCVSYSEFEHSMPFWGGAYAVLLTAAGHAVLVALIVAILSYHLRDFKQDTILAMDLKEAAGFMVHKVVQSFSRKKSEEAEEDDRQVLSPEFALAEMEYQVDELLFKMSALCDGVSLPSKPNMYYTTDSDGTMPGADDVQSTRIAQEKMEDENSLARLLHLQSIGTELRDGEQGYNRSQLFRSQLELDVLRQLQMSHPRDAGINVWDNLRGVSVESAFSDAPASENDIPIHRHDSTVYHSYQRGESEEDDNGSFISIPDESHTPFHQYSSNSPPQKHSKSKRKKQKTKTDNKHSAKAEVYELTEHSIPVIHNIEYHNDAYASDVEVELEIEYTPSTYRSGGGFIRKTRSMTHKSLGAYQNQAYDDDEGDNCQQTDL